MVKPDDTSGVETELTFLAPPTIESGDIERAFPDAIQGTGFTYMVSYISPDPRLLGLMRNLGVRFPDQNHTQLERFLSGDLAIDNMGLVAGTPCQEGGPRWIFIKSGKNQSGEETHLRAKWQLPENDGMWQAILRASPFLGGVRRSFQRWTLPEMGCTLDLRVDWCGEVKPRMDIPACVKTIEVEVDPNAPRGLIPLSTLRGRLESLGLEELPPEIRMYQWANRSWLEEWLRRNPHLTHFIQTLDVLPPR